MKKMNKEYFGNAMCRLSLIFVILKLTKQIDWTWWAVTSPIWILGLFGLVLIFILLIFDLQQRWRQ